MLLIGIGTGGIKTNANTLVAEQYIPAKDSKRTLQNGERVTVDFQATMQRYHSENGRSVELRLTSFQDLYDFLYVYQYWLTFFYRHDSA